MPSSVLQATNKVKYSAFILRLCKNFFYNAHKRRCGKLKVGLQYSLGNIEAGNTSDACEVRESFRESCQAVVAVCRGFTIASLWFQGTRETALCGEDGDKQCARALTFRDFHRTELQVLQSPCRPVYVTQSPSLSLRSPRDPDEGLSSIS